MGRRLRCPWCVGYILDANPLEHLEPVCETFVEAQKTVRAMPTEVLGRFQTMTNSELERLVDSIKGTGSRS